jgi:hypothetical protein
MSALGTDTVSSRAGPQWTAHPAASAAALTTARTARSFSSTIHRFLLSNAVGAPSEATTSTARHQKRTSNKLAALPSFDHLLQLTGDKRDDLDSIGGNQSLERARNRSAHQGIHPQLGEPEHLLDRQLFPNRFPGLIDQLAIQELNHAEFAGSVKYRRNSAVQMGKCRPGSFSIAHGIFNEQGWCQWTADRLIHLNTQKRKDLTD